ncbi:hypothetical protein DdX_13591 [Ditylenchus destructor]|uniref:SRR1-like domain-containing protein n=1 Tax=Ditylenchus destructor TaxID=166010 RepID=A0AAD4MTN5_9BILA|nr:hypothetical protein DdX_13591 [Ditylenchus destructor]
MQHLSALCLIFLTIPSVAALHDNAGLNGNPRWQWAQALATNFGKQHGIPKNWQQQCPTNAWGNAGRFDTDNMMGAKTSTDYPTMLRHASRKLEKHGDSFMRPILKAVEKALRGRTLEVIRLIGTGTMNPKRSRSYKGSVYQIALALKIYKHFKSNGTKILYQELTMGPGERQFWDKYGKVLSGSDLELKRIPGDATPKHGVTLLYFIGAPTELVEDLLHAYRSFSGKIILITDNIKIMDERFLGMRPGYNYGRIRALRSSHQWHAFPFPESPIFRYYTCQSCNYHTRTAVQWKGR